MASSRKKAPNENSPSSRPLYDDGGARPSAGRLLGIRIVARISEAVTRPKAGSAGRLTRWKPMVATANAVQPAALASGQPVRAAARA
jgi:hypothetical protein